MEIMRPADETRLLALVKQSAQDRARARKAADEASEAVRYALPQQIVDLGRLAEPALIRVKNVAQDPIVRSESELLLLQLEQYRHALAHAQTSR
jgi:hypothetical protein